MRFKKFTIPEASKIVLNEIKAAGLGAFVTEATVMKIMDGCYRKGVFLAGDETSVYVRPALPREGM